jgi:hypothetical protein
MAECDGYRTGFVAVFRKYEGLTTDEDDPQGRPLTVSRVTFSRHLGISEAAFRRWIAAAEAPSSAPTRAGGARSGQMARQAIKSERVPVEDKVGMLSDLMSDPKVLRAYREQRAPQVSEADAKAASAIAKALTDPIARSATKLQLPMWLDQLRTIKEVLSEYEFDENEIAQLERALRKVQDELEVQKFRLGIGATL